MAKARKAVVAAVTAAVGVLGAGLTDGALTETEAVAAIVAALVAAVAVYRVPNAK